MCAFWGFHIPFPLLMMMGNGSPYAKRFMTIQNGKRLGCLAPYPSDPLPRSLVAHELCNEIYFIFPISGREHMNFFFRSVGVVDRLLLLL